MHMFHASLIPCISLDQYLNSKLNTLPNMQKMRFFCCSVYIKLQEHQRFASLRYFADKLCQQPKPSSG